jgi:hypothetical protein
VEFQLLTMEHLYFFTRQTLGLLLKRAGFSPLRWAAGSVAPANSRLGRIVRADRTNRLLFLAGRQAELVVLAGEEAA